MPDSEPAKKQRALLLILLATCERSVEAFQAADNRLDDEFFADLERIVVRTRRELEVLNEQIRASTPARKES